MSEYERIGKIFSKVEQARGTKEKTRILQDALKVEPSLEKVLQHLYDPQYVTGINKTSFFKDKEHGIGILTGYEKIEEFIDFLHKNNSGKDSTTQLCRELYLNEPSEEGKQLIYWITTKDINIGISRGTVEKLVKIPKFEIMLGSRIEEKDIDWERQFILTLKMDGVNLTCFKRGENLTFFTRQGKTVEGLTELENEYKNLPDGVYFGEAIYSGQSKDREELYRLSTGEISQKKENKQIDHYLFDYTTLEEWDSNNFVRTYKQTYSTLEQTIKGRFDHIKVVEFFFGGAGKDYAMHYLKEVKDRGDEGLMLRYSSSVYEKKRSKNLIKLKPFYTLDLRIIDYKEFKHPGQLGAFVVDYKGCPVSVGSGYSLEQRDEFWNKRNEMIGKIIEVQTMEETQDKSGKKSLRFPVFLRVRDDKDEPSYD